MKILAKVRASEFLTREFQIDCGLGNQFISWLAQTACLQFSQVHYPKGIYVPNLLMEDGEDIPPHPRQRINKTFKDGDIVHIELKNRGDKQTDDYEMRNLKKDWYAKAFGPKQNLMCISVYFEPVATDHLKKGKYDIYANMKYSMFPELTGEFPNYQVDFPSNSQFKIDEREKEPGVFVYEQSFEVPYGTFEISLSYGLKNKPIEEVDLKPIPESEKILMLDKCEPIPRSMDQLRQEHAEEEEENKKREIEARLAQKRLEEEKSRLRYEQQQQIAKQEQNTAALKVYFEAMNLGFHTGEEDFNASMSVLSIYHQDLMDNFTFYCGLQEQKMMKDENKMITLSSFVHFMKIMGIASTREDVTNASDAMKEIDGVNLPFGDTLNILNGLNYAQFLEAILRIAYWKKNNSDQASNHDGFKNTLETMFADSELDIKKNAKSDEVLKQMLELGNDQFWCDQYPLLAAIFTEKGMPRGDLHELSKQYFIDIQKECGLIIVPKSSGEEPKKDPKGGKGGKGGKETADEGEKKEETAVVKFDEEDFRNTIANSCAFDEDQLGYVDFLEALVRVALVYPFSEEQLAELVNFELKMQFFLQAMDEKYKKIKDDFHTRMNDPQGDDLKYQPRIVVDEDDDEEFDMDN